LIISFSAEVREFDGDNTTYLTHHYHALLIKGKVKAQKKN
jgi:hypothetical protein